jgi:nitrite reductase (NADH) small subunit
MSEWIEVGRLEDIPRLGARVVRRPGRDIAVFRNAADEVFALEDRCPHKGGPLSQGIVHGCRVTCPLHNMVIELETGAAVAPDEGLVTKVPIKIENGKIFLQVETEVESAIASAEGNRESSPAGGKLGRAISEAQRKVRRS